AAVIRFLGLLGRKKEALSHYEHARRILEDELGVPIRAELEQARQSLNVAPVPRPASLTRLHPAASAETISASDRSAARSLPFIGREAERQLIERLIEAAAGGRASRLLFVSGEPGIGKTRLLARLAERMTAIGGQAFGSRAYEAEAARPYGIWTDLLRQIGREQGPKGLWQDLAPLVPEYGSSAPQPADRTRLFDGVVRLIAHLAPERPLALTFDDIQWLDEASSSLLHYLARLSGPHFRVLLACAARSGEIEDNRSVGGILQSLRRDGRVEDIRLGPLSLNETAALVLAVNRSLDPVRIFAESEGNPLFALTLSHAAASDAGERDRTLELVIQEQIARLKDRTRELLGWAAALGRRFTLEVLARVTGLETGELLVALEELERREIVQAVSDDAYDFVHDLLRETAYQAISQPRRKLLHRQIARFLLAKIETDDSLAGGLARHAALADEHEVAVRACLAAGERCLRLFANTEADGFAGRGLHHLERWPEGPARLEARIGLLKIRILAATGPAMRRLPPLRDELTRAVSNAETLGLHAASAMGHYLLSVLSQEAGDRHGAQESTLRAAAVGRAADGAVQARQLANTARCLTELETEIGRARKLIGEAEALARPLGIEICELHWGRGLLQRWDGEAERAADSLAQALALARRAEDRWREYKCLTWQAMLDLERGLYPDAEARCGELMQVAEKLGEEEVPFVTTVAGLARLGKGGQAAELLTRGLDGLRAVDDKFYLAYALNLAAILHLENGERDAAHISATEALSNAEAMQRRSESVIATATLTRLERGGRSAARQIAALLKRCTDKDSVSERARAALQSTAVAVGVSAVAHVRAAAKAGLAGRR
ncbi:MAG TPA: AAA family ATPase, partial [Candidatus Sulfotelmatobacter sp.]|nr:AAA family ATPase [Candidatus Sulfotelmatobacter sp.]